MKILINEARIKEYCQISTYSDVNKLKQEVRKSQLSEIQNFLGKKLFAHLIDKADVSVYPITFPAEPELTFLFFGGQDANGIWRRGVEEALSNYVMASFDKTNAVSTPYGLKEKTSIYSQTPTVKEKMTIVNNYIAYAWSCLQDMKEYINEEFPTFVSDGCGWSNNETRKPDGAQFFKI